MGRFQLALGPKAGVHDPRRMSHVIPIIDIKIVLKCTRSLRIIQFDNRSFPSIHPAMESSDPPNPPRLQPNDPSFPLPRTPHLPLLTHRTIHPHPTPPHIPFEKIVP